MRFVVGNSKVAASSIKHQVSNHFQQNDSKPIEGGPMKLKKIAALLAVAGISAPAFATNGMNMEGYGPIATGMGGASMAYDNGTAAVMNNPATLALSGQGSRIDLALGFLGPDVSSRSAAWGSRGSDADSFLMPAFGYKKTVGKLTHGFGIFAQGGMGAEYSSNSAMDATSHGTTFGGGAMSGGQKQRSELGVGRILFPLAYQVDDKLTIGGSADIVWGGLDILWSEDSVGFFGAINQNKVSGATWATLGGMGVVPGGKRGAMGGTMIDTFVANFGGAFTDFHWGHFAFNDNSAFTQEAMGYGLAGKLGLTYKVNDRLTIGATYHSKTAMKDFEGDATLSFKVTAGGVPAVIPVASKVKVIDFQWPETFGLGFAYQATDKLMVAADYKRLNWSDVMKNFHMRFTANATQTGMAAAFASTVLDYEYYQNWKDQDVINLGVAYKMDDKLTLRAGYNHASNPVPNNTVNFLFPATVEDHYTIGFGYAFTKASDLNFSMTFAGKNTVKESVVETLTGAGAAGTTPKSANTIDHSQLSWQVMYSHNF
ncbi:MAG: outer membrane protein transport protein [Pseudomonadota bacterium]